MSQVDHNKTSVVGGYDLDLYCCIRGCDASGSFTGHSRGPAIQAAKKAGWSVSWQARRARCSEHRRVSMAEGFERVLAAFEKKCGNCGKTREHHDVESPYRCHSQGWSNWYEFAENAGRK